MGGLLKIDDTILKFAGNIGGSADLNNYTTAGIYRTTSGSSLINKPEGLGNNLLIRVSNTSLFILQEIFDVYNFPLKKYRIKQNTDTWSGWNDL